MERDWFTVEYGLHSYVDAGDAMWLANTMRYGRYNVGVANNLLHVNAVVAIIPKGSFYYVGKHTAGKSIASNQLIITDEIIF